MKRTYKVTHMKDLRYVNVGNILCVVSVNRAAGEVVMDDEVDLYYKPSDELNQRYMESVRKATSMAEVQAICNNYFGRT